MNSKRQAADFKKKYRLNQITSKSLCFVFNRQGYIVVEFNGINDIDEVTALKDALGLGVFMEQSRCFTYRDDKYRIVFINENLNEEERLVALAHEEGHIWNDHLTKDNVIGNDVIQEYEANEFAHYLLKDKTGKKTSVIVLLCALVAVAGIIAGIVAVTAAVNSAKNSISSDIPDIETPSLSGSSSSQVATNSTTPQYNIDTNYGVGETGTSNIDNSQNTYNIEIQSNEYMNADQLVEAVSKKLVLKKQARS